MELGRGRMLFSLLFLALLPCRVSPQSKQGGSPPQNSPSTPSAAQVNPPAGITNGTLSIEATILAYRVLAADAVNISAALTSKTTGRSVIIGSSADIAAFLQLRIVLGEASILKVRLASQTQALDAISIPSYSKSPATQGSTVGAGFIASPADVATLIQTLGSITAVNETLSSAPGSLSDSTLINLLASKLRASAVYIPAAYPPKLLSKTDLSDTYIGAALEELYRRA
jgi:hypothetical protein